MTWYLRQSNALSQIIRKSSEEGAAVRGGRLETISVPHDHMNHHLSKGIAFIPVHITARAPPTDLLLAIVIYASGETGEP